MSHFFGQNMSAEALIKSPWWLLLGHPWLAHTWYRKTSSQTQNLPMQWWKVVGLYCRLRKPREEGGIWEMAKNGQNGQKWLEYLPKDLYRLRMATFLGEFQTDSILSFKTETVSLFSLYFSDFTDTLTSFQWFPPPSPFHHRFMTCAGFGVVRIDIYTISTSLHNAIKISVLLPLD